MLSEKMTYPIALAKQATIEFPSGKKPLHPRKGVSLPTELFTQIQSFVSGLCDFHMVFDPKMDYYFGKGNISRTQYDFRLWAASYMTVGLGINSNLLLFGQNIRLKTYYVSDTNRSYLGYMSPWDSLMHATYTSPPPEPEKEAGFFSGLVRMNPIRADPIAIESGAKVSLFQVLFKKYLEKGLYDKILTQKDLKLVENDGDLTKEYYKCNDWHAELRNGTTLKFSPQRNTDQDSRQDFIAEKSFEFGESLEFLMNEFNNGQLFGPRILEAMEMIGYATPRNPATLRLYSDSVLEANEWKNFKEVQRMKENL